MNKTHTTSTTGISFIQKWEGFRSKPYQCSAYVWTIGYGTTQGVTSGGVVVDDVFYKSVSKDIATLMFQRDLKRFENAVNRYVKVRINQRSFDALVSFCYNVGIGAFESSTLLRKLNEKDYIGADKEFDRWIFAGGKKLRGLQNRRDGEQELFDEHMELPPIEEVIDIKPVIQKPLEKSRTIKASATQIGIGGVTAAGGIAQGVDIDNIADTAQQAAQVATTATTLGGLFRDHWAEMFIIIGIAVIGAGVWAGYARYSDYRKTKNA